MDDLLPLCIHSLSLAADHFNVIFASSSLIIRCLIPSTLAAPLFHLFSQGTPDIVLVCLLCFFISERKRVVLRKLMFKPEFSSSYRVLNGGRDSI
jgi:hypothetical protein